jgi:hypothetical protein
MSRKKLKKDFGSYMLDIFLIYLLGLLIFMGYIMHKDIAKEKFLTKCDKVAGMKECIQVWNE